MSIPSDISKSFRKGKGIFCEESIGITYQFWPDIVAYLYIPHRKSDDQLLQGFSCGSKEDLWRPYFFSTFTLRGSSVIVSKLIFTFINFKKKFSSSTHNVQLDVEDKRVKRVNIWMTQAICFSCELVLSF